MINKPGHWLQFWRKKNYPSQNTYQSKDKCIENQTAQNINDTEFKVLVVTQTIILYITEVKNTSSAMIKKFGDVSMF